jgi:hypothetical protein
MRVPLLAATLPVLIDNWLSDPAPRKRARKRLARAAERWKRYFREAM